MTKRLLLVTNNVKALEVYGFHAKIGVDYLENGEYLDVLLRVRDLVHKGWHLMSHPQASNLKPNQSPYKTVLLSNAMEIQTFSQDVDMVENSIEAFYKFTRGMVQPNWPDKILSDFRTIDLAVVESAARSALMV